MRTPYLGSAALLGLAIGIGGGMWLHHAAPEPSATAPLAIVAIPPAPPVPAPVPAPAPAPTASAVVPPAPVVPKAPDLPTVAVGEHNVHTINDDAALPIPTVTLHQMNGRVATLKPDLRPAPSLPAAASSRPFTPAMADKGFDVAGLPVHLFGVRPPDPRDRCGSGAMAACDDGARAAVAARLVKAGNVKCTVPAGQRGDPGYVCRDGAGVDLGGLLVSEGLALADTRSSYNYLGAQNAARSSRRGLWGYR
ncbi:MAG TPA: hypothetical protein VL993_10360 [Stellaceae bacterium]|nr:hypothetical protein [Stellaceae bacterium]